MSNKTTCPGCDSYLSDITRAFDAGEPCPVCGLSAQAAFEIEAVRMKRGDESLKQQLEEALIRAGKAETEARRATRRLERIKYELERSLSEDPDEW